MSEASSPRGNATVLWAEAQGEASNHPTTALTPYTDTQPHRQTERQRQRDRGTKKERQRDRHSKKDRQTARQTDRETESQRNRGTDRDRERHRQRDREIEKQSVGGRVCHILAFTHTGKHRRTHTTTQAQYLNLIHIQTRMSQTLHG